MLCALGLLAAPSAAAAHPLGNFTVNHFNGLTLHPDRIDLHAVIDLAEIPTVQERPTVDGNGDGTVSPAEADAYADRQCGAVRRRDDGHRRRPPRRLAADRAPAGVPRRARPGSRPCACICELTTAATLDRPATIEFRDAFRADRIGWHELVVTGDGVRTVDSALPATSVSDELRAYPEDLLADPLDVRAATFRTEPGTAAAADRLTRTRPTRWSRPRRPGSPSLAGSRDLTPLVGVLAVLLSLVLGASHAALPGHGKTVIAAYLAGKNGSVRDAVTVGATVTVTHTAGVLVLGLLISGSSAIAGESVLGWLGVASGLLVALIGAVLLRVGTCTRTMPDHRGDGRRASSSSRPFHAQRPSSTCRRGPAGPPDLWAWRSRLPSPVLTGAGSRVCGWSALSALARSPVVRGRRYTAAPPGSFAVSRGAARR